MSLTDMEKAVEGIAGLRGVFITLMPDCLLFDSWTREDRWHAEDVASYFGDLVRDSGALVTEPPPVRSMAGCAAMGGAPQLRWLELAGLGALLLAMRGRRPCGGWPRRRAAQTCGHLCRKRSMLGRCGGSLE